MRKPLFLIILFLMIPSTATAQVFGQFTTAAIACEGEGGVFAVTGTDEFRTGVMGRFELSSRSDLALQIGFDRQCGSSSLGAGIDVKFYIVSNAPNIPVDLAIDASIGYLRSKHYSRSIFGFGLLASGLLKATEPLELEPYASITFFGTYFGKKPSRHGDHNSCWPCIEDDWTTDTETILRGGVKIPITNEFQLFIEIDIGDETALAAALNVVF